MKAVHPAEIDLVGVDTMCITMKRTFPETPTAQEKRHSVPPRGSTKEIHWEGLGDVTVHENSKTGRIVMTSVETSLTTLENSHFEKTGHQQAGNQCENAIITCVASIRRGSDATGVQMEKN
ncbi:hypothetical protein CHS0354_024326 [Potamilus streckersoni]|uniref:Uncharacterized protein n=1 Tax=Potamilus streckersoni TaxID=2493646 RepID=A0AAE0VEY7_9BIVA|nr:hypothetical protein CHS0354_024326 [Potamilus streckersoni]